MVNKIPSEYENFFDIILLKFIDTHLDKYYEFGLTPNIVTTFSLISGCLSAYLITKNKFTESGLLYLLSYYFDCVDGKLARKYNMVTIFGDYYDHFSDIIKVVLIVYALYKNDSIKMKKYILIIILLFILAMYQMGCQQTLYPEDTTESPTLDIFKSSVESCKKNIYNTKYFGSGTFVIVLILMIIFWKKI
jgi:hypothetical protein